MSYTAPTVTASGETFAEMHADGLAGHVERAIAANTAMTQTAINLTRALLIQEQAQAPMLRLKDTYASYLQGNYASIADFKAIAVDLQYAYALLAAVVGEFGVLADANPGYQAYKQTPIGNIGPVRAWS